VGDHLIICTYGPIDDDQSRLNVPKIILVDERNRIKQVKNS
jgi:aspartate 1-decarboxylase